jgi:hypothetical protein
MNHPYCIRCLEDFPVDPEPTHWQLGSLRPVAKAPPPIRRQLASNPGDHLCGNCYFDLTDV